MLTNHLQDLQLYVISSVKQLFWCKVNFLIHVHIAQLMLMYFWYILFLIVVQTICNSLSKWNVHRHKMSFWNRERREKREERVNRVPQLSVKFCESTVHFTPLSHGNLRLSYTEYGNQSSVPQANSLNHVTYKPQAVFLSPVGKDKLIGCHFIIGFVY